MTKLRPFRFPKSLRRCCHCGQYLSKKRPSRFVILSASFGSLAGQRSKARAQDDTAASASFDSQHVFFEMYCLHGVPLL